MAYCENVGALGAAAAEAIKSANTMKKNVMLEFIFFSVGLTADWQTKHEFVNQVSLITDRKAVWLQWYWIADT